MLSNAGSSESLFELDAPALLASSPMAPVVQHDVDKSHLWTQDCIDTWSTHTYNGQNFHPVNLSYPLAVQ